MSLLNKIEKKQDEIKSGTTQKNLYVIIYIIISGLFIIYSAYGYLAGIVYNTGQEQGYVNAVQDLASQISASCEPITVSLGEDQINVINYACLQQTEVTPETLPEAE